MGQPARDPALEAETARLREQAKLEKQDAIQERVSRDTREAALRFGTAVGGGQGASAGLGASTISPGMLRFFGGRR